MRGLAVVVAAALLSGSCVSAVRHPAITVGVVGFAVGFTSCEVEDSGTGKCAAVGGGAALLLGGIAALVMLIAPPEPPDELGAEAPVRSFKHALDAGVDAPPAPAPDATP